MTKKTWRHLPAHIQIKPFTVVPPGREGGPPSPVMGPNGEATFETYAEKATWFFQVAKVLALSNDIAPHGPNCPCAVCDGRRRMRPHGLPIWTFPPELAVAASLGKGKTA